MTTRTRSWLKANFQERDPQEFINDMVDTFGFTVVGPLGVDYYVDGSGNNANASDSNAGTEPELPFLTLQAAITASNATINWSYTPKNYNRIWVTPAVYAESLTPAYYCEIIGMGTHGTDTMAEVHPAAGSALSGTGLGLILRNMRFESETAVPVLDFGICNNSMIIDCEIVRGIAGLATMAIQTDNATHLRLIRNRILSGVANFPTGFQFLGGADKFLHASLIWQNWIWAATTGIDIPANCTASGTVIQDNVIARPVTGISDLNGGTFCTGNKITASTDAINHANLSSMCVDNHVLNNVTGAIEYTGT